MKKHGLKFSTSAGSVSYLVTDLVYDSVGAIRAKVIDSSDSFKITFYDGFLFAESENGSGRYDRSEYMFDLDHCVEIPEQIQGSPQDLLDWVNWTLSQ